MGPKDGLFEYLKQYVAAGFNPRDLVLSKLDLDYTEGGPFFTTKAEKAKVHSMTKLSKKFADMGAFLFELGYDLSPYVDTKDRKSVVST